MEEKKMENKIKINKRGEKFINFMKKYGYYIVAGMLVIAITLTVVLTTTGKSTTKNQEIKVENIPAEPVNAYALAFDLPLTDCTVAKAHVTSRLVYNETLGWFETHSGLDLVSATSSDVLSAAEGTVTEIYTNDLEGTVVVIKHNDVYTTKYGSLDGNLSVKLGDKVQKGQKIGTTSTSAKNESMTGAHLHFELYRDNSNVNPADYLNIETK